MAGRREVLLLLGLARVVGVDLVEEVALGGLLEEVDHGVVDRVAVLIQPAGDVVGDDAGVVGHSEVGVLVGLGLGALEVVVLAQVVGLQLLLKGLVAGLGVDGLLLQDG